MSLISKLNSLISCISSGRSIGFQASEPSGKSMKSSMPIDGLKEGVLLCVVWRDSDGPEPVGLVLSRLEDDLLVEVDDRDISLCDLRWDGSHCKDLANGLKQWEGSNSLEPFSSCMHRMPSLFSSDAHARAVP
jgi:hypothetical protein